RSSTRSFRSKKPPRRSATSKRRASSARWCWRFRTEGQIVSSEIAAPVERRGAAFERAQLIVGGKAQHHRARAGFDIFVHPVDHLVPAAGDAQHRIGDRFVRAVVIFRQKSLAFVNRILAAGGEGEIDA